MVPHGRGRLWHWDGVKTARARALAAWSRLGLRGGWGRLSPPDQHSFVQRFGDPPRGSGEPARIDLAVTIDAQDGDDVINDVPESFDPRSRRFSSRRVRHLWVSAPTGFSDPLMWLIYDWHYEDRRRRARRRWALEYQVWNRQQDSDAPADSTDPEAMAS